MRTFLAWCGYPFSLALNFLREKTPESSTRLCAVLLCATGCGCAIATLRFSFLHPDQPATIAADVTVVTALIASGCVAIINRTRNAVDAGGAS